MSAANRREGTHPHSRSESAFSIDKDKLIQSMYRISTFLTAPSTVDEISRTLSINEYPYGDGRLSDISYVDEIMTKILDEVIDTLGFDRGIICLLDDEKENLVTRVVKNYEPEEAHRAFSVNLNLQKHDSFETRVVKTGQYITLEDSETDPRITETDRKITRFYKRGSTFYAPLKMEDEVTGLIAVWTKDKTRFTPEEIDILLTFANQVSIIIQTTRLFDNNREKIFQLLDLQKAATALNACSVIDEIHEILLKNAVRLGKAEKALLYFLDVERNKCLIYDGKEIVVEDADAYSGRIDQSIIRKVIEREAILVQEQTSHHPPTMMHLFDEYPSEIAFPLKIRDNFKGVLYLGKKGGGLFAGSDQYSRYSGQERRFIL